MGIRYRKPALSHSKGSSVLFREARASPSGVPKLDLGNQRNNPYSSEEDMSDWTAGYVADIGYTFGYYTELNPPSCQAAIFKCRPGFSGNWYRLRTVFWSRYERQCSRCGIRGSVAWHGLQPCPDKLCPGTCQRLGAAHLVNDAFAEFCTGLPFRLHCTWIRSWISDENRHRDSSLLSYIRCLAAMLPMRVLPAALSAKRH